jgi:hypothetical protein
MDGTGTANLVLRCLNGDEAEQTQDVGQRNHGTDIAEANTRHGRNLRVETQVAPAEGRSSAEDPANREEEPVIIRPSVAGGRERK